MHYLLVLTVEKTFFFSLSLSPTRTVFFVFFLLLSGAAEAAV